MGWFILILILLIVSYLLFIKNKTKVSEPNIINQPESNITKSSEIEHSQTDNNNEPEWEIDENGKEYRLEWRIRKYPRKTFLHGHLIAKYRGEEDLLLDKEYYHEKFFPFEIYEAVIKLKAISEYGCKCVNKVKLKCEGYHKEFEGPFFPDNNEQNINLTLPQDVVCISMVNDEEIQFKISIKEIKYFDLKIKSKLHQIDGNEIFGTLEANVTGYILDYLTEEYQEKVFKDEPIYKESAEFKNNEKEYIPVAGNSKIGRNISQIPEQEGCLPILTGILGLVISGVFLLIMLPSLAYILPFVLLTIVIRFFPANALVWFLRILSVLICLGFIFSLFTFLSKTSSTKTIPPSSVRTVREFQENDSIIKHFMSWQAYDSTSYSGAFWTKKVDYENAKNFKANLKLSANNSEGYNKMIYDLKENDKYNLNGIYQLFDSLKKIQKLSDMKFADMVVSFVQNIPYSIVLPQACNSDLYGDRFVKKYLSMPDARCDGFERFGINTPVEFMTTLNGDCDTRTLLLYTIFTHYNYDVVLLSSELYGHSLIGINLPYEGAAFLYENQRYVLWETTAKNIKAGIIANEVSNLNYWKISLKSK